MLVCVRVAWLQWRRPLRDRSSFQAGLMGASVLGVAPSKVVQTRLRTAPAMASTMFFLALAGFLVALGADHTAVDAAYGATGIAAVIWVFVALYNRPRWMVPPALRREPGMAEYERRQPEPPFRDPRAVPPPPREKVHRPGS